MKSPVKKRVNSPLKKQTNIVHKIDIKSIDDLNNEWIYREHKIKTDSIKLFKKV